MTESSLKNYSNNTEKYLENKGKHDDSFWHIDKSITLFTDEKCVTICKKEGEEKEQVIYPKISLIGDFEITMDVKTLKGNYITFILNTKPQYGGTITGWRNMPEWTSMRIKRKKDIIEIYYGNPEKPQAVYTNGAHKLFFLIRFNGLLDENKLYYKNFSIYQNNQITFLDIGNEDNFEYMVRELNNTKERMYEITSKINDIEKKIDRIDSINNFLDFVLNDTQIKTKGTLQKLQNISKELLKFVIKVCEKYEYNYWLDNSSLLGAVRYEGFIPWENSLSIGLIREEYNKIIADLKKEIITHKLRKNIIIELDTVNTENNYANTNIKIKFLDNTQNLITCLNIYPYDYLTEIKEDFVVRFNKEKDIFNYNIVTGKNRKTSEKELYDSLSLSYQKQKYLIPGVDGINNETINKENIIINTEYLFPLKRIKFEDEEYNCPNNYDNYLKFKYDDYQIPVIKYDAKTLEFIEKERKNEGYYEYYLSILKNNNEKF